MAKIDRRTKSGKAQAQAEEGFQLMGNIFSVLLLPFKLIFKLIALIFTFAKK